MTGMSHESPVNLPVDRLEVVCGDITTLHADAIVNAANEALAGGGGVDGAIHRAAGKDTLLTYCEAHFPDGCPTGLAVRTPAFGLEPNVQHIFHTVGPVWQGAGETPGTSEEEKLGYRHEDVLLATCYLRCLELCPAHDIKRIAFPAISTGVYGFPGPRAAKVAVGHTLGWLAKHPSPHRVIFCCFSEEDAALYRDTIDNRNAWMFNRKRM